MTEKQVSRKWATASLLLNLVLLGWVAVGMVRKQPSPTEPVQTTEKAVAPEAGPPRLQRADNSSPASPEEEEDNGADGADWKSRMDRIRALGVPSKVLVAMVQCDFDQRWQIRDAELYKKYQEGEVDINDLAILNLERESELEQEIRNALGEEDFLAWDQARQFFDIDMQGMNLTDEETSVAYNLCRTLTDRFRALEKSKLRKEIDQATYENLRDEAQAEYDRQFRKQLGQERYNMVRDGGLSAEEKRGLRALDVGPEQMDALSNIQGEWSERLAELEETARLNEYSAVQIDRASEELHAWRNERMKAELGEEAFDFYQKRQDSRYVEMTDYAADWGLSESDIDYVHKMLVGYDEAVTKSRLQAIGTLPDEEIDENLKQFSEQVSQVLRDYLGPEKFRRLEENKILP